MYARLQVGLANGAEVFTRKAHKGFTARISTQGDTGLYVGAKRTHRRCASVVINGSGGTLLIQVLG